MSTIKDLAEQYDSIIDLLPLDQKNPPRENPCIVLSGVSGSGKTTIGKLLEKDYGYSKLRNTYTRPKRANETERDGIFIDTSTFHAWKQQGKFITTKITNRHWHGLTKDEMKLTNIPGKKVWADKSVGSVQKLGATFHDKVDLIYIVAPSFYTLHDRIAARNAADRSLSAEDLLYRFTEEIKEFRQSLELPYRYIVNNALEDTIRQIL